MIIFIYLSVGLSVYLLNVLVNIYVHVITYHVLFCFNYYYISGRNGYGAKLANIFSKQFVVETADSKSGLRYRQVFRDNMVGTNVHMCMHYAVLVCRFYFLLLLYFELHPLIYICYLSPLIF